VCSRLARGLAQLSGVMLLGSLSGCCAGSREAEAAPSSAKYVAALMVAVVGELLELRSCVRWLGSGFQVFGREQCVDGSYLEITRKGSGSTVMRTTREEKGRVSGGWSG
jgi:hypothetical protein